MGDNDSLLNLISDIVDFDCINDVNFYNNVLIRINKAYPDSLFALFFNEDSNFILKSAVSDNKVIKNFKLDNDIAQNFYFSNLKTKLIKTQNISFLKNNTLLIKLTIKDSLFGFMLISSYNISKNDIAAFNTIVKTLSYKIKDFELENVFKLQLSAMQDAYEEKENAYSIIKKQHNKLQEIDKTKNLFLANISHELRTPLNAIIGFSQALDAQMFGELNEKQAEYIKDIQISSLHLLGMINEILDISKIESNAMKFCPIEISPQCSIQEVVNILEPLYKNKNINLEFINKYSGNIKADNQKFQQILYNLLSNAIKFTNDNGKIIIEHYSKDKNYILKVKDNGIGIDKKNHSKIFKKFVHLNNLYTKNLSSTGLGLTITKELVKLHKGKITLTSEPNKGSCFTMEFKNILV